MKLSVRYDIFIGLDSIHDKLSSDQSLNVSRVIFHFTDGQSSSQYRPLENVHFLKGR